MFAFPGDALMLRRFKAVSAANNVFALVIVTFFNLTKMLMATSALIYGVPVAVSMIF